MYNNNDTRKNSECRLEAGAEKRGLKPGLYIRL
jgi:hypothetical protein